MNISGISSYWGFYDYNSIQSEESDKTGGGASPIAKQSGMRNIPEEEPEDGRDWEPDSLNQPADDVPDYTVAEYTERYQPYFEYDLSGADSDICQLDVTRAISDMQKDQVLQQYQFFVGSSRDMAGVRVLSDADSAAVRKKEDCAL